MILNIINSSLIRNVRSFETLAKSSCPPLLTQFGRKCTSPSGILCRQSFATANSVNSRSLTKIPTALALKTSQIRAASTHGDHVRLWVLERVVAAALPILLPAALILETPLTDGLVALLVVMHTHWGLEAIIVDYARPIVVGHVLPKVAFFTLYVVSAATLAGLLMLIFNGPGLSRAIKDFWAIGKEERKETS